MEVFYCNSDECSKKDTCYRRSIEFDTDFEGEFTEKIGEDFFSICKSHRLYIEQERPDVYSCKDALEELFNFMDNICKDLDCTYSISYKDYKKGSGIECKKGKELTCSHPKHPKNEAIELALKSIHAMQSAIDTLEGEDGETEFVCPECGGIAKVIKQGAFQACSCTQCDMMMMT